MIDQSHNVEGKIDAMVQSVMNIQTAYAKALLVDEDAVAAAQREGDVLGAHRLLLAAYESDVRPLLARLREELGVEADPVAAFRRRATRSGSRASAARPASRAPTSSSEPSQRSRSSSPASATRLPEAPRAVVAGAGAARARGRLPRRADVLRPDAREQRLPRARRSARAPLRRAFEPFEAVVSPSSSCVGAVRELYPARGRERRRALRRARTRVARLRAVGAARRPARRDRRRRVVPAPRDLPPDVPLAAGHPRRRRAAAAAGPSAGSSSSSSTRRGVLRLRRHVRAQERRHVERDPRRQVRTRSRRRGAEVCTAVDGSCLLQIGGGLSRRGGAVRTMHLAEILASTEPADGDPQLLRTRPAASSRTRSCARTSRNATDTIRAKRARVVAELPDWEELREAGRAIKADVLARLDELAARVRGRGRGGRRPRALGARRGRGERGRRRRRARARRGRGREGEVAHDGRDRASTPRSRRRASTRSRPTSPS